MKLVACRDDVSVWSDRVPLLAGGPEDDGSGPGLQHQSKKVSCFSGKHTYCTLYFLQLCNTGIFCFVRETEYRHKNDFLIWKEECSPRPPLTHCSFLIKPYFTHRLVVETCTEFLHIILFLWNIPLFAYLFVLNLGKFKSKQFFLKTTIVFIVNLNVWQTWHDLF